MIYIIIVKLRQRFGGWGKEVVKVWLPAIFWAGLIFLGSSLTPKGVSTNFWLDFGVKKSLHFVEYFVLYWLVSKAKKSNFDIWALAVVILYAVSDEWHQSFVPGREPNVLDVLLDTSAGLTAWLVKKRI